jgi:asparagine N-glycosylation enzyme membrane subunit Stt3
MEEESIIKEREKKFISFVKKEYVYVSIIVIILLIIGVYIRSIPLQKNIQTGKPGLWDFAKNEWTLGPDLDPWLFTRYAKTIVENGSLPKMDIMRNVPLGFDTTTELQMVSYMIVLTYKFASPFYKTNLEYYAALMPVLLFALTIISFFFFTREVFIKKHENNLKADIIAALSTFFMIIIPAFVSRTVAGIPEKESVGFFFMFLSFFLYLRAWKTEKLKIAVILGILSGVSTALMGLSWGGVIYIYVAIAVSSFVAFILNKMDKKESLVYSLWIISSLAVTFIFTNRFSLMDFFNSLDTGMAILVFLIVAVDFLLWKTKLKNYVEKMKMINESKMPKQIWSIIIAVILGIILVSIIFGPGFIIRKIQAINQMMFRPIAGRWGTTVAENRQPYFWEWASSFGPFIDSFPVLFWLFLIGSVLLFKNITNKLQKKNSWTLTGLFVFFLTGLIFSRYSAGSTLNGENFISKLFYYSSALIFLIGLLYYYIQYNKEKKEGFSEIPFEGIFILFLGVLCIFTARSAVRLIMTLAPIAPIFASYLCVKLFSRFLKTKEESSKMMNGIAAVIVAILVFYCFFGLPLNTGKYPGFFQQVNAVVHNSIPSYYNLQWQYAMSWVNQNTDKNAVFAHWWDYGYWMQSIGNRATVTDGGNAITYWNYLSGRYVLTGDNQKDAVDFLYTHNATHLLIDSSDLGKYGAFSQIGSDINFDRLSQGPVTFLSNEKMMQEKSDSVVRIYQIPRGNNQIGIVPLEEDLVYTAENSTKITFLKENSALIEINLEIKNRNNNSVFGQPIAIFAEISTQKRFGIPARYLYYGGRFFDFGSGINATIYLFPKFTGNSIDLMGAAMYISPRLMRGLLAQVYILNDPLNNFPKLKLVHAEKNTIINSIESRDSSLKIGDFMVYQTSTTDYDVQGPIKIWEVDYSGDEKARQEFLDRDYTKYISWQL